MIKLILRLADIFHPLIAWLGADYAQFRAILETKLTMDARRPRTGFQNQTKQETGTAFTSGMLFYAFFGFFIGMMFLAGSSLLVKLTIVHSMVMTMLAMSLIADFSGVLLDTTDNMVLQPRPVSGRTILLARIAHIMIYLGLLGFSLTLVTLIVGTVKIHFLFPLVFVGTLLCSMVLIVCLVSLFYLSALRLMNAEKVRDVILYFQVFMSIGVFAAYQLMPRLVDMTQLRMLRIDDRWWIYLFPPTWMAAPADLAFGHAGRAQILLTLEAILVPALGLLFIVRVLAPRFNRALAEMEAGPVSRPAVTAVSKPRGSLASVLSRWVSHCPVTRAAFELVWNLCARDRQFKLRTYPSITFVFLIPLPMLFTYQHGIRQALSELHGTHKHLFVLYMSSMLLSSVILQIRYCDKWQAAWIYESLPIRRPGEVLVGALLAVIVRFLVPTYLLLSASLLAIWGPNILPDILLAFCMTVAIGVLQSILISKKFPFSQAFNVGDDAGRFGKSMFALIIPLTLCGLHYLLTFNLVAELLAIPVALLFCVMLVRRYAATSWAAFAT